MLKKSIYVLLTVILLFSLVGCESQTAKDALNQAKLAMAEGDYAKAQKMYRLALDEGSKDETIKYTLVVLDTYDNASEKMSADSPSEAKEILDSLRVDYSSMPIKNDMDSLKESASNRINELNSLNAILDELQALFDQGDYASVQTRASEMLDWNLTEEQKTYANYLANESNAKIQEITEKSSKKNQFLNRAKQIENYSGGNLISTFDMIEHENAQYEKWDKLLNDVYQYLKQTLPADEFSKLQADETKWIKEKEDTVNYIASQQGSMYRLEAAGRAVKYTSERCYYLISLIK